MKLLTPLMLATSLALVACGGKTPTPEVPVVAEVTASGVAAHIVGGAILPDPCTILTPALAAELLQIEKLEQQNINYEEARVRACNYDDQEGSSARVLRMSMGMYGVEVMSSARDSKDDLVAKAIELSGGATPIAVLEDIGNIAFVFDQDDFTRLQILTGIGDTSEGGEQVTSELQLGYALNFPQMEPAQRQQLLVMLARQHLALFTSGLQR